MAEARDVVKGVKPAIGATSQDAALVAAPLNGFAEGKAMSKHYNECMAKLGYESVPLS